MVKMKSMLKSISHASVIIILRAFVLTYFCKNLIKLRVNFIDFK